MLTEKNKVLAVKVLGGALLTFGVYKAVQYFGEDAVAIRAAAKEAGDKKREELKTKREEAEKAKAAESHDKKAEEAKATA